MLSDLESIAYSSYLCELLDICLIEEESNRELFKEFVSAFYLIKNKAVDFKLLARSMEIKLLQATGYGLNLETCSICGRKINTSSFINIKYSGGICNECAKSESMHISNTGYNILKYLIKTSISNIYKLTISEDNNNELYKVISTLLYTNFGKIPKSLEVLNYL